MIPGISLFNRGAAFLFLILLVFGGIMVLSPTLAEALLFQPSRGDPGPPPSLGGVRGEALWFRASDGVKIHGWWFHFSSSGSPGGQEAPSPRDSPPAVLLLHGNAGDISHRTPLAEGLLREGLSVLLLEYRGYGASEGRPGEEGFILDAMAGMEFLEEKSGGAGRVAVFGRSMGGAVAVGLASRHPPGALILEAAFTSLEAMGRTLYPFLPGFLFRRLRGRFDTLEKMREVQAPVLVIHGTRDEIVPFSMGEALYAAAPEARAWYPVREAGHNDVFWVGGREYFQELARFIRRSVQDGSRD